MMRQNKVEILSGQFHESFAKQFLEVALINPYI
jgi:hypothetical protein